MCEAAAHLAELTQLLSRMQRIAVAVSGGVDSMTLAVIAHRALGGDALMIHAVSPAVPALATERVQDYAAREGWSLRLIDAGEFDDPDYLRNPVNRCFFCKRNLYGSIAGLTGEQIVSGTNLDDLGDYRPGLEAARDRAVRHPYVEAGIDKAGVRALADHLGLDDIADLPAAPCLASRIETGLFVTPRQLRLVEEVESLLRAAHPGGTVRARVRATGLVVELGQDLSLEAAEAQLGPDVAAIAARHDESRPVRFATYRRGSAFVGAPASKAAAS